MSFSYTKNVQEGHAAGLKVTCGTWSCAGVTSGTIYTGLNYIVSVILQSNSTTQAYPTATPANGLLQAHDGIAFTAGSSDVGTWIAVGL